MQSFISTAGPALDTVTTLNLVVSQYDYDYESDKDSIQDQFTALLRPLVQLCPLLQHLKVSGDVSPRLLAVLGTACKNLSRLETKAVPFGTLRELQEVLPSITSTHMILFGNTHDAYDCLIDYAKIISSSPTLHHLDIGQNDMIPEIWRALPACLQQLHIGKILDPDGAESGPPACGLQLPSLQEVHFAHGEMPLSELAILLRAAPRLHSITMNAVTVPCTLDQIPDLVAVHHRLSAGLTVKQRFLRSCEQGLLLCLKNLEDTHPDSPASKFVASLPVFQHYRSLGLETVEQPLLSNLTRAFPDVRMLGIHRRIESSSFPCLMAFPSLQSLSFSSRSTNTFTAADLAVLCMQLPALQFLGTNVHRKREWIVAALQTWGRRVQVE